MTTPAETPKAAEKAPPATKPVPPEFLEWVRGALNAPDVPVANPASRDILGKIKNLLAEQDALQRNLQQMQQQISQANGQLSFLNGQVEGCMQALLLLEGAGQKQEQRKAV